MKNYAAIILVLTVYDLSGQPAGLGRFLFEPVIRPLDYRPPEDYNASRGRGGLGIEKRKHLPELLPNGNPNPDYRRPDQDNRVTPNVQGDPSAYGRNPRDYSYSHDYNDGTYDQNSSNYFMPGGVIYHGSDVPLKELKVGNPLNGLDERWHTAYSPDVVAQNLGRFTPPDNGYNPNLTLHGTIAESPWEFFAPPQISMDDWQNNLRNPVAFDPSDGGTMTRGTRLTTLNWDTMNHEGALGNPFTQMERIDALEMGGFYQDGMSTDATAGLGTGAIPGGIGNQHTCSGHVPVNGVPTLWHFWEQRHFSSLSRAGLDAKRSIPLDGVYAYDAASGQHHFQLTGGTNHEWRRHWDWKTGSQANKLVFNVGFCFELPFTGQRPATVSLDQCSAANAGVGNAHYVEGGADFNARYEANNAGGAATSTGNDEQDADNHGDFGVRITGTTSNQSEVGGNAIYADSPMEMAQNPDKTALAGHPTEWHGSSLSPWQEAFGYDLSRFFGDFYVEPSVWTSNRGDIAAQGTGQAADKDASSPDFENPLDKGNQISTRQMDAVLRMGDMRRKIRHINRFPQAGLDYLFQSEFVAPNGSRVPVFTQ
ncbi:MAG: hypothetical protein QF406_12830 [Verrucomicrobiota bacterium]|jgi:hypothetical protein|nr:hypothetical protein [Verrucomicrobiota bacterium]